MNDGRTHPVPYVLPHLKKGSLSLVYRTTVSYWSILDSIYDFIL